MKKRRTKKIYNVFLFFFVCFITIWFFSYIDNRFLPVLKEVSHIHCKAYANKIINSALEELLSKNEQNPSDFVFYDIHEDRYSANTLLLNQFCTTLNENIASYLSQFPSENITIPFGAVFDASLIADKGPDISFTIYPAGNVTTNFEPHPEKVFNRTFTSYFLKKRSLSNGIKMASIDTPKSQGEYIGTL